jgi:hypothetical protein
VNVNTVVNVVLIAAAVVWILWKQVQHTPIKARLLVAVPLVLGYFGVKDTPTSTWSSAAAATLIVIGAAFSIALGLARGATLRVWREQDGRLWQKGSKYTMFLWGALLIVRVIVAGVASATHNHAATGLGPILLSLALTFAAQNAVTGLRMSALSNTATPAGHPTAAWAEDDVPTPGRPSSPSPTMYPAAPASYGGLSQRRADRHARRAARRDARYDRYR